MNIPTCTHTSIELAGQSDNQTAWGMFLSFHMGVSGLVAHPWVARPTGKTPAIPDGTLHLTTNLLNVQIHLEDNFPYIIPSFMSFSIITSFLISCLELKKTHTKKNPAQTNISQHIANLIVACYCCYCLGSLTISSWCSQICSVLMQLIHQGIQHSTYG